MSDVVVVDYRASSTYGTNPYEGRKYIRALWEMQGLPEVVDWIDSPSNKAALIGAYIQAARYACPHWPSSRAVKFADERYAARRAEVRRHHGTRDAG